MEIKFLLDSNAVIDFLGAKYPQEAMNFLKSVVDDIPNISIISEIEVLSYKTDEEEYKVLQNFCMDAVVLELSDEIVTKTIEVRIKHKLKVPDAIITATARVHNMTLITRNVADFGKIPSLSIINPWDL
jgi:predicted nucleic acid-binding protein